MKKFLKYLITIGVGLLLSFVIVLIKDVFNQESVKSVMKILTDAFFATGVFISCYGGLVVAANGGTFDMIIYGTLQFFSLFKKDLSKRRYKDFYEYRKTKQSSPRPFFYLIIVGIGFILMSMLFLMIYFKN